MFDWGEEECGTTQLVRKEENYKIRSNIWSESFIPFLGWAPIFDKRQIHFSQGLLLAVRIMYCERDFSGFYIIEGVSEIEA